MILAHVVLFILAFLVFFLILGFRKLKGLFSRKDKGTNESGQKDPAGKTRMPVDFSECAVIENVQYKEDPDTMTTVSYIVFETSFLGQPRKFGSIAIKKDKVSLELLLMKKRTTYLYVNKENPDNYFFDLNFLHNDAKSI